jgi:transcriptional antiterminator RfaH
MVLEEKSWFVCQTNTREEKRAKYFLEEKGLEVHLPIMEAQKWQGVRRVIVQKPLFPNYLFVRFYQETDMPDVRWTRGVRKILPECLCPVSVDDQVVESIRALAQEDQIIRRQPLRRKDRVRIVSGPFKEIMGVFQEWTSDQGRIRILLQIVDCQMRLELHHTLVEKVTSGSCGPRKAFLR